MGQPVYNSPTRIFEQSEKTLRIKIINISKYTSIGPPFRLSPLNTVTFSEFVLQTYLR